MKYKTEFGKIGRAPLMLVFLDAKWTCSRFVLHALHTLVYKSIFNAQGFELCIDFFCIKTIFNNRNNSNRRGC